MNMHHDSRLVHIGSRDRACLVSLVHEGHHLMITAHNQLGEILYVWSQTWMFPNPQIPRIFWVQKVTHFLVIDL